MQRLEEWEVHELIVDRNCRRWQVAEVKG
jgi:hypothetical protein